MRKLHYRERQTLSSFLQLTFVISPGSLRRVTAQCNPLLCAISQLRPTRFPELGTTL